MGRKKADCCSRWKSFKPRLSARGKQKLRPGRRFPAAASPCAPPEPRAGGWEAGRDPRAQGCWLRSRPLAWVKGTRAGRGGWDAPHCPPAWPLGEIRSGHPPLAKETSALELGLGQHRGQRTRLGRGALHPSSGNRGTRHALDRSSTTNPAAIELIIQHPHHGRPCL